MNIAWHRRGRSDTSAPLLFGCVDGPCEGEVLDTGLVVVRGWHVWDGRPVLAVAVSAGGVIIGRTGAGTEHREDVAAALQDPGAAEAGWRVSVPLAGPAGPLELTIHVWPSTTSTPIALPVLRVMLRQPPTSHPRPMLTLSADDPSLPDDELSHSDEEPSLSPAVMTEIETFEDLHCELDLPAEGAVVDRGVLLVAGWSFGELAPASRVEVSIDGGAYRKVRLGIPRPDIPARESAPHAGVSGFEDLLDLSDFPATATEITVEVRARDHSGRACSATSRTVQLTAARVEHEVAGVPESGAVVRALNKLVSEAGRTRTDGLSLVVFTHQLGFGGGQLWLSTLLERSGAGRDFPCTVMAPADGPLRAPLEQLGIDVHVAAPAPLNDGAVFHARVDELAVFVRALEASAVLVNTTGAFAGVNVASACNLPAVWAIHESYSPELFVAAAYPRDHVVAPVRQALRRALQDASALVFEAEQTRQQYLSATRAEHCLVIPYGVDAAQANRYCERVGVSEARSQLGLPDGARVIVVVGTTEPRKAQTVIAQAFAEIAEDYPDVILAVVGRVPGPYGDGLERYFRERGLNDRVVLAPVVRDIYPWYRCADLLLCASDVESLPRAVLEAMSFEVPVLATSVFGLPDLITDGVTGFLFEPRDIADLVDAMRRVLDLDARRLRGVGAAGGRHVQAHYDAAGYAADIRSLLEGLSSDPLALPATLMTRR